MALKMRFLSPNFWLRSNACWADSLASLNCPLTFICSLHCLMSSSICAPRSFGGADCACEGDGELLGDGAGCCAWVSALPVSRKTPVQKRGASQFLRRAFMARGRVLYGRRILNLYSP